MMLYSDFENKYQVSTKAIKGIIPVSGVFEIAPLIKTDINDNLGMDLNVANKLSPLLMHSDSFPFNTQRISVLLAYGEDESNAFKQQSTGYFNLLKKANFKNVNLIEVKNVDHFNVIENLSEDDFSLTKVK